MSEPQITYRVAAHLSSKGDLAKAMGSKAAAVGGLGAKLDIASSKAMAFGKAQASSLMGATAAITKYSAAVGAMGLGAGMAVLAAKGAAFNVSSEKAQNTIAGTLQLMNHSAGAADQLGTNIKVAGAALQRLSSIADDSPGELQDIQNLFKAMLPGARAATGEMERILELTRNAAVFTPTLGGDFMTVGAQISRSLTGGAGSEMDVFRTLGPAFIEVGSNMDKLIGKGKIFEKTMEPGEKLTQAFNKLDRLDRLKLFEKVFERGGPAMSEMYKTSFEGASSTMISSLRKIAGAFTQPMFNSLKDALIKAGGEGGAMGKGGQAGLMTMASKLGGVFNKMFMGALGGIANGIIYLQNNWESIANRVYHGMQIGAGMIKAAFAYGFAKMMIGSAAMAAAGAARGVSTVGRGVSKGYGMSRAGIKGVGDFARGLRGMVDVVTKGNPISNAIGLTTALAKGFSGIAMAGVTLIPMLLVAGLAIGAMSFALVGIAGIAVYVTSKWKEITGTLYAGLQNGTITMRPLIIAAMVLWERLKAVGAAFLGVANGGSLITMAMNFAVGAIDAVSNGVVMLMGIASGFLRMIAGAYDILNPKDAIVNKDILRMKEVLNSGLTTDDVTAQRIVERRKKEGVYDEGPLAITFGEKASAMANKFDDASKKWRETDLKDLNLKDVDDLTKKADDYMKTLTSGDDKTKRAAKGAAVNIGHLTQQFDLRGEDPDRAMVAWVEPIERLARTPGGSTLDVGGF